MNVKNLDVQILEEAEENKEQIWKLNKNMEKYLVENRQMCNGGRSVPPDLWSM